MRKLASKTVRSEEAGLPNTTPGWCQEGGKRGGKALPQEPRANSGPTFISEGSGDFDLNLNIFSAPSEASTLDRNTNDESLKKN